MAFWSKQTHLAHRPGHVPALTLLEDLGICLGKNLHGRLPNLWVTIAQRLCTAQRLQWFLGLQWFHHDPPQKLLALLLVASLATSSFLLLVVMPLATSSVLLFLPFLFRSAPWRRCLSQKAWRTREGASPKQLLQPNGFHPAPWRATSNVPKGCSYSQEYDTYRYTDTYGSGSKPGPLNPCYSVHVPWSTPLVDFGDATLSCSSLAAMLCVCSSAKGPKPQRSLVELEIQRRSLDTKPGSQLLQPP